jgi:hypothetical protein
MIDGGSRVCLSRSAQAENPYFAANRNESVLITR